LLRKFTRFHRSVAVTVALAGLLLVPATVRASTYIAPFVGFNGSPGGTPGSATCVGPNGCDARRINWGASIGSTHGVFGVEADISYIPTFFDGDSAAPAGMITIMSNFMLLVPDRTVRPYVVGGIGVMRPHAALDLSGFTATEIAGGVDVGGGVMVQVQKYIGVRSDVRHFRTLSGLAMVPGSTEHEQVNFWRGTVGVVFSF